MASSSGVFPPAEDKILEDRIWTAWLCDNRPTLSPTVGRGFPSYLSEWRNSPGTAEAPSILYSVQQARDSACRPLTAVPVEAVRAADSVRAPALPLRSM